MTDEQTPVRVGKPDDAYDVPPRSAVEVPVVWQGWSAAERPVPTPEDMTDEQLVTEADRLTAEWNAVIAAVGSRRVEALRIAVSKNQTLNQTIPLRDPYTSARFLDEMHHAYVVGVRNVREALRSGDDPSIIETFEDVVANSPYRIDPEVDRG